MPQPELFGAVFALMVAAAHFLTQRGRPKKAWGNAHFVRVKFGLASEEVQAWIQRFTVGFNELRNGTGNLLAVLQKIFGAVFALIVAAAHFLTQLGKRRPPIDDDGPVWQLLPPGTPAGRR